jgi:hypothetical protein
MYRTISSRVFLKLTLNHHLENHLNKNHFLVFIYHPPTIFLISCMNTRDLIPFSIFSSAKSEIQDDIY